MSLSKTKEFYTLLRAQLIKEISEDNEISKILSSDAIHKLDELWQQKLEQSGVYQPTHHDTGRNTFNNIQPYNYQNYVNYNNVHDFKSLGRNTVPYHPGVRANPVISNPSHQPRPLMNNQHHTIFESDIKKEEYDVEVKQEYKHESDSTTLKADTSKKSDINIKIEPIKPKKTRDDEDEEDDFAKKENSNEEVKNDANDEEQDDADLFHDTAGDATEKAEKAAAQEAENKRKAPEVEEVYTPLGSDDSVDDGDNVDTTDMIVGYHEKVNRTGSKWKVQLKHCIMNLKGKEYILSSVNGEFDF